jgi:ribonuclease Z
MRPNLHPRLVNGRFGDPALFVEMLHRREALLFDAGELSALTARDLLRVSHVFISHMHIDHFIGFDALLRVNVGREKTIQVTGPPGIIRAVGHKLNAYDWDLVDRYKTDLVFEVVEIGRKAAVPCRERRVEPGNNPGVAKAATSSVPVNDPEHCRAARFRFKRRFEQEELATPLNWNHPLGLKLETALLEHHGPCLGFAISEPAHVNIWKTRLEEHGLATGPWLQHLKNAVLAGAADDKVIQMPGGKAQPLGSLRDLVSVTRGQKITYVTDVADSRANRLAIASLARGSDLFFIEARFSAADHEAAAERAHLTTSAAGELACAARVRRLEPFHFSPRYDGEEERMLGEVFEAFNQCRESQKERPTVG